VPFLVEDEGAGPLDSVVEHNTHVLLHYAFSDDHGCRINVFDGPTEVAQLTFIEESKLSPDPRARAIHAADQASARAALHVQGIIDQNTLAQLEEVARTVVCTNIGPQVATALGLLHVAWLSGTTLSHAKEEDLQARFPGAYFVNRDLRGKAPAPRSFEELMALPVPNIGLSETQDEMVQRHYRYWTEFGDFDDERSQGFWMYERYESLLPKSYRYLPDQLMNLRDGGPDTLARIRAIIGLTGPEIDWEPYLLGY
jgi:hypothetical protein